MNVRFLTKIPGILRLFQLLTCFIGFICIVSVGTSARGDAFLAATIAGFIINIVIVVLKVLDLHEKIGIPWNKVEFVYDIVWAVFLLITSALVIDTRVGGYIAGGTFGLFATIAYLIDAGDKFTSGF